MHFSGALLTLYVSFCALTTAARSPNPDDLARDSQQSTLEPRGNTISAAKVKFRRPLGDGSTGSSGSAKALFSPKIQCSGHKGHYCVHHCRCTIDGTVECNESNAPEIGSIVPYLKILKGEDGDRYYGSSHPPVTDMCSQICGCDVDGTFKLGGRPRTESKVAKDENVTGARPPESKDEKVKGGMLDHAVRRGTRKGLDAPPEGILPDLPVRQPSPTTDAIPTSHMTDVAQTGHPSDVTHSPADQKSSASGKTSVLQKLGLRRKLPPPPVIRWPRASVDRFRKVAPALPVKLPKSVGTSRTVPILPSSTSDLPKQNLDALNTGSTIYEDEPFPPTPASVGMAGIHGSGAGSNPAAPPPQSQHDADAGLIQPSPTRHRFADEASSSTDRPKFYRRGNSLSAKVRPHGYDSLPDGPPEGLLDTRRRPFHGKTHAGPTTCIGPAQHRCQSGCYCTADGNIACDQRTQQEIRQAYFSGSDVNKRLEEIKESLIITCTLVCGCVKDGETRVAGRTKEEWLEIKRQGAIKTHKQADVKVRPDSPRTPAGSEDKLGRMGSFPDPPIALRRLQAAGPDHFLIRPGGALNSARSTEARSKSSVIERSQTSIQSPSGKIAPSGSDSAMSRPISHAISLHKRGENVQKVDTVQIACNGYMKPFCEQFCRCNLAGRIICDKTDIQHLEGSKAPVNWVTAQRRVMEEIRNDCSPFCKCEKVLGTPGPSNEPSSSSKTRKTKRLKLSRRGGKRKAADTATSLQPLCRGSMKVLCEKNCYCTDAGEFRCDNVTPQSFEGYESLDICVSTTLKLRAEYSQQCTPECSCDKFSHVRKLLHTQEASSSSTMGSKNLRTRPEGVVNDTTSPHTVCASALAVIASSRPRAPATKALSARSDVLLRDAADPLSKRAELVVVCSPNDLERKRQCEDRCYCSTSGELKCDTQYPRHFDYIEQYARMISLSKEKKEQQKIQQIELVTNFCLPACKCVENPPSRGGSAEKLSAIQKSNLARTRPTSYPLPPLLPSRSSTSSLHRRGKTTRAYEAQLSKPVCENSHLNFCVGVCRCVEDPKDLRIKVKCDVRNLLPAFRPKKDEMTHQMDQYNSDLIRQCTQGCVCEQASSAKSASVLSSLHSARYPISPSVDAAFSAPASNINRVSFSNQATSLHRRVRPLIPDGEDQERKPTCRGQATDCELVCLCTPGGVPRCDVSHLDHVSTARRVSRLIFQHNDKLTQFCSYGCNCEKHSYPSPSPPAILADAHRVPHITSPYYSRNSVLLLLRRGRPIPKPDPEDQEGKPTCQGYGKDYCEFVCKCTPEGHIECDIRHIPHIPASQTTMRLIYQHNFKVREYCSNCKCEGHSSFCDPPTPSISADTSGVVRNSAGALDAASSSSNGTSLHQRGRPISDLQARDPALKPTCRGPNKEYYVAHYRCTPANTVLCDMRYGFPLSHIPSEHMLDMVLQENSTLWKYCVPNCSCTETRPSSTPPTQTLSAQTTGNSQDYPSSSHDPSAIASSSDTPPSLSRRGQRKRKKTAEDKLADTATSKRRPSPPPPTPNPFAYASNLVCKGPHKQFCDARCSCSALERVQCVRPHGDRIAEQAIDLASSMHLPPEVFMHSIQEYIAQDKDQLTRYCSGACHCKGHAAHSALREQYAAPYRFLSGRDLLPQEDKFGDSMRESRSETVSEAAGTTANFKGRPSSSSRSSN